MANSLKKIRDIFWQGFLEFSNPTQIILSLIGISIFVIAFGLLFKSL